MKNTKMLKKNYEFKRVLSKGIYYSGDDLEAFILKNNKKNINFLGLAISVKVGKAVKRNHLKRLIRENYYFYENHINLGYSIVFLLKKKSKVEDVDFYSIKNDMKNIFDKANLLKREIIWRKY